MVETIIQHQSVATVYSFDYILGKQNIRCCIVRGWVGVGQGKGLKKKEGGHLVPQPQNSNEKKPCGGFERTSKNGDR